MNGGDMSLRWRTHGHCKKPDEEIIRLNCSFSPLTFPKLRFWPPKKKNYKTAP